MHISLFLKELRHSRTKYNVSKSSVLSITIMVIMNIHFHFYHPFQIFPSKSRNRASIKSLGIQMLKVVPGVIL